MTAACPEPPPAAPASPGEAAFRQHLQGGLTDRDGCAVNAWRSMSFEVRDRWEAIASAAADAKLPRVLAEAARYKAERDEARAALDALRARIPSVVINFDETVTEERAEQIRESIRAALAEPTIAQAAAINSLRHQLTTARERLERLAAGLEASAAATAPSRKSQVEAGCAQAVRDVAREMGDG